MSRQMRDQNVKVIYILGCSRSGSTLLDTLLDNHTALHSCGELAYLPRPGWLHEVYCSCGMIGADCALWEKVVATWQAETGAASLDAQWHAQNMFERYRSIGRLLQQRNNPSSAFNQYARYTRALFGAIQAVSDATAIVDSSKKPFRALALSMVPGIDLYVIHLVRDGRGVAWSLKKSFQKDARSGQMVDQNSENIFYSALHWTGVNLLSAWTRQQILRHRSIIVRYEDLVFKPDETLCTIGEVTGLDFTDLINQVKVSNRLRGGSHTIAGNSMRMAREITLRPDITWRENLSAGDQRWFNFIGGWLLRRYGYEL